MAAKPFSTEGWHSSGTGMIFHGPEGHWGQVVFRDPYVSHLFGDRLHMSFFAGSLSPYLMRWVNKLDPDRSPHPNFVAAHTQLLWAAPVAYTRESHAPPPPLGLDDPPTQMDEAVLLCTETAPSWLADAMAVVMPRTQALCSDVAIREWLLERNPPAHARSFDLRYAVLLTRHLGLEGELSELLERARQARDDEHTRLRARGLLPRDSDRSTRFPQSWSHKRFLRFLKETPP
jgi:hypothetical protein